MANMTRTIAAVKYACDGEARKEFEIPTHKTYNLQPTHEIFERGEVSELSDRIGMPLVVMQLRPSLLAVYRPCDGKHRYINGDARKVPVVEGLSRAQESNDWTAYANYGSKDGADYFPNDTAARLMIVCSAGTIAPLLCPPAKWMDKVGSVLIARQDMVPLHPMHIEVLKSFITAVHESLVEQSKGHGIIEDSIAETITPCMWRAYWEMATAYMEGTGQGTQLEGVPAPFADSEKTAPHTGDEGGVQLDRDPDMMECSDIGFTQ